MQQQHNVGVDPKDLCTVCSRDFYSDNFECVECSDCLFWCHLSCVDLSKEEYEDISEKEWFCPSCSAKQPANPYQYSLPSFSPCADIRSAVWGGLKGENISSEINNAYNTVIKWKKNLFKLPGGKCGKAFVSEVGNLINLWVDKSKTESVALTALHVFVPLMLQKPSKKSKNRDHIRYLKERLEKWKIGDLSVKATPSKNA